MGLENEWQHNKKNVDGIAKNLSKSSVFVDWKMTKKSLRWNDRGLHHSLQLSSDVIRELVLV